MNTTSTWLIERGDTSRPEYLAFRGWTRDPFKALRYDSEREAKFGVELRKLTNVRVCEHGLEESKAQRKMRLARSGGSAHRVYADWDGTERVRGYCNDKMFSAYYGYATGTVGMAKWLINGDLTHGERIAVAKKLWRMVNAPNDQSLARRTAQRNPQPEPKEQK